MPDPIEAFAGRLTVLGWVSELWVAGSAASGDHHPGVSDLDLVAVVDGRIDAARHSALTQLHRELETGPADGANLGCAYVEAATLLDLRTRHPTWTHGRWIRRTLSGTPRVELVLPRMRTALIAWRDARQTVALARRDGF